MVTELDFVVLVDVSTVLDVSGEPIHLGDNQGRSNSLALVQCPDKDWTVGQSCFSSYILAALPLLILCDDGPSDVGYIGADNVFLCFQSETLFLGAYSVVCDVIRPFDMFFVFVTPLKGTF